MSHKPSHGYEDEPQEGEAGGENGDIGGLCADGEDDGDVDGDDDGGGENGDIGGLCADGEDDGDCVDDGIGGGHQENISPIET